VFFLLFLLFGFLFLLLLVFGFALESNSVVLAEVVESGKTVAVAVDVDVVLVFNDDNDDGNVDCCKAPCLR